MNRHIFLLTFLLACIPLHAAYALVQETESVEEPDATDLSSQQEQPNYVAPKEKSPEDAAGKTIGAQKEAAPGENMEGGFNTVILEGLNKVTGHASRIEAVIGSTVRFGTLEIEARSCWQSAPGDRPENAALLEISEIKQGEAPEKIFLGWMFSSSPGLSSLEHPFYDITVITCAKTKNGKL